MSFTPCRSAVVSPFKLGGPSKESSSKANVPANRAGTFIGAESGRTRRSIDDPNAHRCNAERSYQKSRSKVPNVRVRLR